MQLSLFTQDYYLPDEVIELQYRWVQAIEARQQHEQPTYHEITDGVIDAVYLSVEYHKARRREFEIFDQLCSYGLSFRVFQGVESWLHK